jgi:hypothetical protein
VVAIRPYYHGLNHQLEQADKIKHVAAYQRIKESGSLLWAVHMMFFDACFLVQYMLIIVGNSSDTAEMEISLSFL